MDGHETTVGLWAIRRKDATQALHAWTEFFKCVPSVSRDALRAIGHFNALIAAYGLMFLGKSAIKGRTFDETKETNDLHDKLMRLRDEAVAHSDIDCRSLRLLPPPVWILAMSIKATST